MLKPGDLSRRVPSLREHLGDEPRADGFTEWTAAMLEAERGAASADEAKFLRIANTFAVACVEQMQRESNLDPSASAVADAMSMWSRAAGFVTITALASVARPDTPFRRLARVYAEEFKIGAKMAADQLASAADKAETEGVEHA